MPLVPCPAEHRPAVTCGLLQAAPRPGGRGAQGLPGVSGAFLAVCPSEARAAPPFQLCHHLVPGDVSGSEVHAIPAEEGVASLNWLLSQTPWRFQSGREGRGPGSLRALPASCQSPPSSSDLLGSAHILLASSLYFLGSTHPSLPPLPLTAGETQLSQTWPTIPTGRGQFSQTELLFHQQTLFQSLLFCGQFSGVTRSLF